MEGRRVETCHVNTRKGKFVDGLILGSEATSNGFSLGQVLDRISEVWGLHATRLKAIEHYARDALQRRAMEQ